MSISLPPLLDDATKSLVTQVRAGSPFKDMEDLLGTAQSSFSGVQTQLGTLLSGALTTGSAPAANAATAVETAHADIFNALKSTALPFGVQDALNKLGAQKDALTAAHTALGSVSDPLDAGDHVQGLLDGVSASQTALGDLQAAVTDAGIGSMTVTGGGNLTDFLTAKMTDVGSKATDVSDAFAGVKDFADASKTMKTSLDGGFGTLTSHLSDLPKHLGIAAGLAAMKQQMGELGGLPDGDAIVSSMTGSLQGGASSALTTAKGHADDLMAAIGSATSITPELVTTLQGKSSAVGTAMASVQTMVTGEKAQATAALDQMKSFGDAMHLKALFNNPFAAPALGQLVKPDVFTALTQSLTSPSLPSIPNLPDKIDLGTTIKDVILK